MDHTKAPDYLWYQCLQYASTLLNHTATRSLDWKTPLEVAFGLTPDISALLQYAFYEPIYYYYAEVSFPHSRELPGRFLGIAENVGDALTFQLLTDENRVIYRSVMRSALDTINVNQRALLTDNVGIQKLTSPCKIRFRMSMSLKHLQIKISTILGKVLKM